LLVTGIIARAGDSASGYKWHITAGGGSVAGFASNNPEAVVLDLVKPCLARGRI